jgi:autotransporter-associated beta strand protein
VPSAAHTLTIANVITGPGPLSTAGPGTLALSAANTYSGDTRPAAGALLVSHAEALAGSTLDMASGDTGAVTFDTPAAYTLGGLKGTRDLDMGGKTLSVGANNQNTAYSGALSNGALTKVGGGILTLSGINTFTGVTIVSEGVLALPYSLGSANLDPASVIQLDGGSLRTTGQGAASGTAFELYNDIKLTKDSIIDPQYISNTHLRGTISDEGGEFGFTKTGSRNLYLRTANTYQGDTLLEGGTTYVYTASSLGTTDGATHVASGAQLSLEFSGTYLPETLHLDGGNLRTSSTNPNSPRYWAGDIVVNAQSNIRAKSSGDVGGLIVIDGSISGDARLLIGSSSERGNIRFTNANTHSGDTRIVGGTLQLHHALGLQGSTLDLLDSDTGTLLFGTPAAYTLGGLKGSRDLDMGGKTLSVGANGQNTQYSGALSNGALTKVGGGTLTLTGISSYTGATAVDQGTLVVDGSIATSSALTLAAGTLLQGTGSVPALAGAGIVSPGNSPGILTATLLDPARGLDFAFEFTAAEPIYGSPAGSLNDVLRLTDLSAPFAGPLSAGNEISLYLNVAEVAAGDVFRGGFYTDLGEDFSGLLSGATVSAFVALDGNGPNVFEGVGYYSLADAPWPLQLEAALRSVPAAAEFGAGLIGGYVMQVKVVPEPATWLMLLAALGCGLMIRRR